VEKLDEIRKCVFFISIDVEISKGERHKKYMGTGYIVSTGLTKHNDGQKPDFEYLVTAKHVIIAAKKESIDGKIYVEMNTNQGISKRIELNNWYPQNDWEDYDSSVDIQISPFPEIDKEQLDYIAFPDHAFYRTDESSIKSSSPDEYPSHYGVGSEVFVTGLYYFRTGRKRIQPIIRSGIISMMADEKMSSGTYGDMDAYLVEVVSLGGLSGSPVFVRKSGYRSGPMSFKFFLLGSIHAHWDEEVEKEASNEPKESLDVISEDKNIYTKNLNSELNMCL